MKSNWTRLTTTSVLLVAMSLLWGFGALSNRHSEPGEALASGAEMSIPIGVLGDSDSHSYHDSVLIAAPKRGGEFRASTYQWTEVAARLRAAHLDFGEWGVWGTRGSIARLQEALGLAGRTPRKQDYRYNFALSGAECEGLMLGPWRQAPRLVALMDENPPRWQRGVVVIRIGVNSIGRADSLDRLAHDPQDAIAQSTISRCAAQVADAVTLIQSRHPQTRIVVVGVLNNADWPPYFDRWQSSRESANIVAGLDSFDRALGQLAKSRPGVAFFDDRAWLAQRWGSRGADGRPMYKELVVGRGFAVTMSSGDHPRNAVLGDGHAGGVWNALWAQSFVDLLNTEFGSRIPPLADSELVQLLDPSGEFGMSRAN